MSTCVVEHDCRELKRKSVVGFALDFSIPCMYSFLCDPASTLTWNRFWHRRFRRHMDRHKSARMIDIPHFEVPEIIVDDEDGGRQGSKQSNTDGSPHLSATHMPDRNSAFLEAFGLDGSFQFPESGSAVSSPSRSPQLTPHRPTNSAYSFELQEPSSPHHSRQGSGVSAEGVLEVFSESAWGESLRRSFTRRRSRGGQI